jgi:uncharacterized protein
MTVDVRPDRFDRIRRYAGIANPAGLLLALVRAYRRYISPALAPRCRFYPSCSEYAEEAIGTWGAVRGTALSAVRLLKCGPWHPGGIDFVPIRSPRRPARDRPLERHA